MVNNPPSIVRNNNFMLGWPIEYITDANGGFIGFIMPLAFDDRKQLVMLTTIKVSKKLTNIGIIDIVVTLAKTPLYLD